MTGKYLLLALLATAAFAQDPVSITPYQLIDARAGNAIACSNCSVYTYAAGTNTPLATYTSSTLATPNTNPVLTNSAGYAVNGATVTGIWVGSSCYKLVAKDSTAATIWTQDNVCDRGAVLKALLAASTGASLIGSKNPGAGSVARTVQSKLYDFYNVKDFGAVCNGSTDDRVAIQAAVDAVAGGTLYLPSSPSCAVSSPGIYLYPANAGMTFTSNASVPAGAYVAGSGGGLVSTATSAPSALLTIFANNVNLTNLYLDGRNVATYGVVNALGGTNKWTNVFAFHTLSDGGRSDNAATPVTSVTAGGGIGSTALTVSSVTNNRLTFGAYYCRGVLLDYGLASEQLRAVSSVVGNVVNITVALASAVTTIRCAGNVNGLEVDHFVANTTPNGWGYRHLPGNDNNNATWKNADMTGPSLGGDLWAGNGHYFSGGKYQGGNGPARQLGDTSGSNTFFTTAEPISGAEQNAPYWNTTWVVCDASSSVRYKLPGDVLIKVRATGTVTTAGTAVTWVSGTVFNSDMVGDVITINAVAYRVSAVASSTALTLTSTAGVQVGVAYSTTTSCATYPNGSTTTAFGTSNGQNFSVKTSGGMVITTPGVTAGASFKFVTPAGAQIGATQSPSDIAAGGMMFQKDVTSYAASQIEATGQTQIAYKTMIGYNTSTLMGFMQCTVYGSSTSPCIINPAGGPVLLGSTGIVSALPATCTPGDRRFVTDANSTTFWDTAVGAGANQVPVVCTAGNVWKIG